LLVEVVDERSAETFDLLIGQGRKLGFLAQPEIVEPDGPDTAQDAFSGLAPPEEGDLDTDGVAPRHRDLWLQTALAPERLQSRLLQLYYEARTTYEERGVNVLYLALGFLEWYETPSSNQARHAPLLLVPITLTRGSAHESFRVSFSEEDIIANITLREKLKEFSLQLPELEETGDLRPAEYSPRFGLQSRANRASRYYLIASCSACSRLAGCSCIGISIRPTGPLARNSSLSR
jgi:hypothetical protein